MPRNKSEKHPFPEADKQARAFLDAWDRWKSGASAGLVIERWGFIPHAVRERITGGEPLGWWSRVDNLRGLLSHAPQPK